MRLNTLRGKLIGMGVASAAVSLVLAALTIIVWDQFTFRDTKLVNITAVAEVVGQNGAAALAFDDKASATKILASLKAKGPIRAAAIYRADGSVLATYTRRGVTEAFVPPAPSHNADAVFDKDKLRLSRPIMLDGEHVGFIYLESDLTELRARLLGLITIVGAILAASILVALLLSSHLQRIISKPILDLAAVARDVSATKDYSLRAAPHAGDEVGSLIEVFNEMLTTVESHESELTLHRRQLQEEVCVRAAVNAQLASAKQKAEAASIAKGQFLANMSHEIRTPMNGIIGMTEVALGTELTPEQREYLDLVKLSADSLLVILNDILDLSKIEAGKLDVEPIPFLLRRSVAEAVQPLALRAREKGIELETAIDPRVPEALIGDPGRLRQILLNLVSNAIKFTVQGQVRLSVVVESGTGDDVMLHCSVSDTGIGIPADQHAAIFEAFSQADGSTTRRFGGTGLGLTIAASLVAMMGGRIWVESAAGLGSTFHFTARLRLDSAGAARQRNAAAHATPARQPRTAGPGARRILLAEDNAINQRVATHLLEKMGHAVTLAETGRQAVDLANRGAFDLILMDLQMPEMSGLEATTLIRAAERQGSGRTVIVAVTADAMKGDREKCLAAGMDDYISKPYRADALAETVQRMLLTDAPGPAWPVDREDRRHEAGSDIFHAGVNITLAASGPGEARYQGLP